MTTSNYRIEKPNFTCVPNVIFDYWMERLTPAEFKVLLCICRKTFGWHKDSDPISLKQIEKLSNLSRKGIIVNIDKLIELGLVLKIKSKTTDGDDAPNRYHIKVWDVDENSVGGGSEVSTLGGSEVSTLGGSVLSTPTKDSIYTKEIHTKEGEGGKPPPPPPSPPKKQAKEEKVEKTPYRENVFLSLDEYNKLLAIYGASKLNLRLDYLSAKKGGNGYEYKSDYHVLLPANWVNQQCQEQEMKTKIVPIGGDANLADEHREWWKAAILKVTRPSFAEASPSTHDYVQFRNFEKGDDGDSDKLFFKDHNFKNLVKEELKKRNYKPGNSL